MYKPLVKKYLLTPTKIGFYHWVLYIYIFLYISISYKNLHLHGKYSLRPPKFFKN